VFIPNGLPNVDEEKGICVKVRILSIDRIVAVVVEDNSYKDWKFIKGHSGCPIFRLRDDRLVGFVFYSSEDEPGNYTTLGILLPDSGVLENNMNVLTSFPRTIQLFLTADSVSSNSKTDSGQVLATEASQKAHDSNTGLQELLSSCLLQLPESDVERRLSLPQKPPDWNKYHHGRIAFKQSIYANGSDFIIELWTDLKMNPHSIAKRKSKLFLDPTNCLPEIQLMYGRNTQSSDDTYKEYKNFKTVIVHAHLTDSSLRNFRDNKFDIESITAINVRHGILDFHGRRSYGQVGHKKDRMIEDKGFGLPGPSNDYQQHLKLWNRTVTDCMNVLSSYSSDELTCKETDFTKQREAYLKKLKMQRRYGERRSV
jgi:hypothetical protein